ncbi:MAG: aminopeptidase [Acholeplasmatales bacterium]|nr:aminopeptidase [Acholeplasmatales bacterium]
MYGKNAWNKYTGEKLDALMQFNEEYKEFISKCKTERECVEYSIELCKKYGFKEISEYKKLKAGDKVYATNKNRNICAFIIGDEKIEDGINVLGAHIDSPRIDLKQNPLYEKTDMALLDTHYYGGIVKYQWVTHMLAMHGVVCKMDGTSVNVVIGEDENDPVVCITDLLPHLAADKNNKPGNKVIEGEDLDITIGHMPLEGEEKNAVKAHALKLLKEKYNIEEEDFVSAEIEIVPAGKARDLGIDRSMVIGYGHDDRVCAYTSLRALLDAGKCSRTTCTFLVDKEEIGSVGATGAQSKWFENTIAELNALMGNDSNIATRRALTNTRMLSSDVSAAVDPLYQSVFEVKNAAYLGKGICINKYTGARGKSGCNDASPEYLAQIRSIFDSNDINYQTAELGKVDIGGGGTIAYILGNYNMEVVDAGIAVLSMHAPNEVVSKVDVYEAYLAYMAFIKNVK